MTCFYPQNAWKNERGQLTTIRPADRPGKEPDQQLPCGLCDGCRLDYGNEYAQRMYHELEETPGNLGLFITLTYSQSHLPPGGNLKFDDMTLFLKRLRRKTEYEYKKLGLKPPLLRYFYCGEYGGSTSRPHYHMILFGLELPQGDDFDHKQSKKGHQTHRSRLIESAWQKGRSDIGKVTIQSCKYVAMYMHKDKGSDYSNKKLKTYRNLNLVTGEQTLKVKPATRASLKPGIGKTWIEKYCVETFNHGFVIIEGQKYKPSRYYREYCRKYYPELYETYKQKIEKSFETEQAKYNQTPERLVVREECLTLRLTQNQLPGETYKDTGKESTFEPDFDDLSESEQAMFIAQEEYDNSDK